MKTSDEMVQDMKDALEHHEQEVIRLRRMIAAATAQAAPVLCTRGKTLCWCPNCAFEFIRAQPPVQLPYFPEPQQPVIWPYPGQFPFGAQIICGGPLPSYDHPICGTNGLRYKLD